MVYDCFCIDSNNNQLECSDLPDNYVALLEVNLLHGTV